MKLESPKQRRIKRLGLLAAVLALAALSCTTWLLLRRTTVTAGAAPGSGGGPEQMKRPTGSSADLPQAEPPSEFEWPTEFPYPGAAQLQWLEDNGLTLEDWYALQRDAGHGGEPDARVSTEETDPEQDEKNRRFDSGEITVWLPDEGGWISREYRAEEAKVIETTFSVMLPESWDYDGSAPVAAVDFHNGTVAVLFGGQEHGGVYRVTDRDAFENGLASGDVLRGLSLWEYGQFAPDTLQNVREPELLAADWDLNDNVGAPIDKLIAAVREKDVGIFTNTAETVVMFREKKHYVIAGVFSGGEKITDFVQFSEGHTIRCSSPDMPLTDLTEPERLLGMSLADVRTEYGDPAFETVESGVPCACYITRSGFLAVLHTEANAVNAIDLYDHSPTPVTLR